MVRVNKTAKEAATAADTPLIQQAFAFMPSNVAKPAGFVNSGMREAARD
jgi:hypothetical protein